MTEKEKAFKIMEKHMYELGDWLGRMLDPKNPKDDLDGPKCRKVVLEKGYYGKKNGYHTWRIIKGCRGEDFSMGMEVKFSVRPI